MVGFFIDLLFYGFVPPAFLGFISRIYFILSSYVLLQKITIL